MSERDPIAATPVSVAMATYNGLRWLQPQIDSILSNLREGDELVIVDDGSSDGTWERLLELDDPRVHPVRNESNRGVRATFERALSLTRHDIVFLADHPTTGGYPVIAVVDPADIPHLAQAAPGTTIRFRSSSPRRET